MIELFTAATPNGWKVSVALEEMGLPYTVRPITLGKLEQKEEWFLKINPNGRVPAIIDHDNGDFAVFESGAILVYLAEKAGKLLPSDTKGRSRVLQWLMFQMGSVGPMLGQTHHFRVYAPEKLPYAINRYAFEAQRHFGILDTRLAKQKYMLGDTYTIVDMNVWGWARLMPNILGEGGWAKFPNLKRMVDEISARPAAQKAVTLKDRHKFKTEMDAEALKAMFGHLSEKVA